MLLKFSLSILLIFFCAMRVYSAEGESELEKINGQIEQLEEMQEKLRSRARRGSQRAMQLQFQGENHRDSRTAWEGAAQDKQKIEEIQGHLDILNERKQALLQKNE